MTWILTVLSLIGVILNIRKNHNCFYIWAVTNATWAFIDFSANIPAQGVLFTIYFLLALWGIWEWKYKHERKENGNRL